MNVITEVAVPALEREGLHHRIDGERVCLGLVGKSGQYDVSIHFIDSPPLLWMHFQSHFYIGSEQREALLETALALNFMGFLVKCGLDVRDSELVFDAELPLLHGEMTQDAFLAYLISAWSNVDDFLSALQKVRWCGLSPKEALGLDMNSGTKEQTKVESEVDELLKKLEEQDKG